MYFAVGKENLLKNVDQMNSLLRKETTLRELALNELGKTEQNIEKKGLKKKEVALHKRHSRTREDLEEHHKQLTESATPNNRDTFNHENTSYSDEELAFLWRFIQALNRSPKPKKE